MVRAYSQYCKVCKKVGDVGTYEQEINRLAQYFCYKKATEYGFSARKNTPRK